MTPLHQYDTTGLSLPNAAHITHRFPADGEYLIRVIIGGTRPAGSERLQIGVWIDGQLVQVLDLDPDVEASFFQDRQDFSGKARECRVKVTAGDHHLAATILRLYEGLPPMLVSPHFLFRLEKDRSATKAQAIQPISHHELASVDARPLPESRRLSAHRAAEPQKTPLPTTCVETIGRQHRESRTSERGLKVGSVVGASQEEIRSTESEIRNKSK